MSSMRAGTTRIDQRADVLSSTAAKGTTDDVTVLLVHAHILQAELEATGPRQADNDVVNAHRIAAELGVDAALDRLDKEVE